MTIRRSINMLLVSILLLVTLAACAGQTTNNKISTKGASILGTWRGEYMGQHIILSFEEDGTFSMSAYDNFNYGTFTINEAVTPHQLDISLPDTAVITTIYELMDENTLKFENVYPGVERPIGFSDFFLLARDQK